MAHYIPSSNIGRRKGEIHSNNDKRNNWKIFVSPLSIDQKGQCIHCYGRFHTKDLSISFNNSKSACKYGSFSTKHIRHFWSWQKILSRYGQYFNPSISWTFIHTGVPTYINVQKNVVVCNSFKIHSDLSLCTHWIFSIFAMFFLCFRFFWFAIGANEIWLR